VSIHERIGNHIVASLTTVQAIADYLTSGIEEAANTIADCLLSDGKILCCGNAGSAAHSQHFAALMLNGFEQERPGLPAIALSSDTSTLTAIAQDHRFEEVFAKQIRALGHAGDVLMLYTICGTSPNILAAANAAHDREMKVIALTGRDGGALSPLLEERDVEVRVPSESAARIQEAHLLITHCLCDLIDHRLFGQ
jgi:D-sedoheptulose 7-phosphate isomerase